MEVLVKKYPALYIFVAFFAVAATLRASDRPAADPPSAYGNLYFHLGIGDIPIYPRGSGRYEHWQMGVELHVQKNRFEAHINTRIAGAATFDNPDRFQAMLAVDYRAYRRFYAEVVHTDYYSLNAPPPFDPFSRLPTSSVNSTEIGVSWRGKKTVNIEPSVFVRQVVRGDEPFFFPHYTKPYTKAGQHLGASLKMEVPRQKLLFTLAPELYIRGFGSARAMIDVQVDRPISSWLVATAGAVLYVNSGAPSSLRDVQGRPLLTRHMFFIGLKIPFGKNPAN